MSAYLNPTLRLVMIMTLKNQNTDEICCHILSFVLFFPPSKIRDASSKSDDQARKVMMIRLRGRPTPSRGTCDPQPATPNLYDKTLNPP